MFGMAPKISSYMQKNPNENINEIRSGPKSWTPLQVACGFGHDAAVAALLEIGADPSLTDAMGMTALHSGADTDNKQVMALLLEHEKGKGVIDAQDADGCTPLHYAAYSNRDQIVVLLLKAGASTTITDASGETALSVAKSVKASAVVELISNGPPA